MASAADRDEVRLGVLASGTGSLLEAVLEAGLPVTVVVADRPCRALEVATAAGVPSELVQRGSFGPGFDRAAYTSLLVSLLDGYGVDVVAMAGFGTVFSPEMFAAFPGRGLEHPPGLTAGVQRLACRARRAGRRRPGDRHDRAPGHGDRR